MNIWSRSSRTGSRVAGPPAARTNVATPMKKHQRSLIPTLTAAVLLGAAAILLATINIAGGFLVTQRMLKMFRR